MKIDETRIIISMVRTLYPRKQTPKESEMEVQLWNMLLPEPFEKVRPAVESCLKFVRFEPKPADIRAMMYELYADPEDTAEKAWDLFYKTACRLGSYNTHREGWLTLPENIRKIMPFDETLAYSRSTDPTAQNFKRSEFIRAYEKQKEAEKNAVIEGRLQLTELMQNVPQLEEK